ncbi:basic secretory protein-like protein [Pedobacter gandavensis]|uniref:basic secretory protein-like protein n=1 Tax=Pedobacter gandavensis TaxID=2679963 RepID=UPI00292FE1E9|nr:basic secretory protein-like protein [Pedobacter gandavensis]
MLKFSCFFTPLFCVLVAHSSCNKGTISQNNSITSTITKEQDVTSSGALTVSTENTSGAQAKEGSSKLTDNNTSTKFLTYSFDPASFMQISFPKEQVVAAYTLTSGDDAQGRDPRDWKITASNDGTTWIQLDARQYESFGFRTQTKRFSFKNIKAYKYYRLNVSGINDNRVGPNVLFQLAEWRLIEVPEKDQTITPASATVETITQGKYTLTYVDRSTDVLPSVKVGLIDVFKKNYSKTVATYHPNALTNIVFIMNPEYKGVAATYGAGVVRYDPVYFKTNPLDLDVATHEMMHIVQEYSGGVPGWVTEGLADYERYRIGISNATANWTLPNYQSGQNYTDAYRITARFFVWLEQRNPGIMVKLNNAARMGTYNNGAFWLSETTKDVAQLWNDYKLNPGI